MFCVCFVPTLFCSAVHTGDPSCPETRYRKVSCLRESFLLAIICCLGAELLGPPSTTHAWADGACSVPQLQAGAWLAVRTGPGESRARGIEQSAHNCPFLLMLPQLHPGLSAFARLAEGESCGALDSSVGGFGVEVKLSGPLLSEYHLLHKY